MKNNKLTILVLFLISTATFAQPGDRIKEKKEQVRSLKIAFITTELDLSPEESAKFWPIYNRFEDKQHEIRKEKLNNYIDRSEISIDKLSEKEAVQLLNQIENTEEELHQLKKKLLLNLKTVLPATKILKLKKAEESFSKKLLQQYRDKKVRS